MRTATPLCTTVMLLVFLAGNATAEFIVNGDFSDPTPLAGYDVFGTVIGEPTGEFGQLETEGSFIRTLSQTFTTPASPSVLTFDFAFSTNATPFSIPDSFAASHITTADGEFLDILVVDFFGPIPDPSDGIEFLTGAVPIDVSFDETVTIAGFTPFAGGTTYSGRITLDLPAIVLGEEATLFFDLFDELDVADTIAALDNISLTTQATPIPEPMSVVVWLMIGGMGIVVRWTGPFKSRETV